MPIFLASSFAFIAPIRYAIDSCGIGLAGLVGVILNIILPDRKEENGEQNFQPVDDTID